MTDPKFAEEEQEEEEEGEEAFLDMDDPANCIVAENDDKPPSDDDDEDANAEGKAANEDGGEPPQQQQQEFEKDPIRDDACGVFRADKPLHCIAANPLRANEFIFGSEGDQAFVVSVDCSTKSDADAPSDGADRPAASVQHLHTLRGHTDTVTHVAYSPNGELVATGAMDCTVRLWSSRDGTYQPLHTLTDLGGEIECMVWHPSSAFIVAGASDGQAAMWLAQQGAIASVFSGHRGPVRCVAWGPAAKKLLTGSADGSVMSVNPRNSAIEVNVSKDLSPDHAGVSALLLLSDDAVVVGCEDGSMHVVSLSRGKAVHHFKGLHEQPIECVVLCESAPFFVSCSCDCKVGVWNVADYALRVSLTIDEGIPRIISVGLHVLAACTDGDVRVWDCREGQSTPRARLLGHRRMVLDLCVNASRTLLGTVSDDCTFRAFVLRSEGRTLLSCAAQPL